MIPWVVRSLCTVAVLYGCYQPSLATGVPCASDGTCPDGQSCDHGQTPAVCVVGDAGTGGSDAPTGFDASGVGCTSASDCPTNLAVCDPGTHQCRGCVADVECASNVCSESTQLCIAEASSLYVETVGSDANPCTRTSPCATVSAALAKLTSTRRAIRVADGTYTDSFVIAGAIPPILISGARSTYANTKINASTTGFGSTGTPLDHVVEANGTAVVIEGMTLSGAAAEDTRVIGAGKLVLWVVSLEESAGGVDCAQSSAVFLIGSRVANNTKVGGIGVYLNTGSLLISRAQISGNGGPGVQIMAGSYDISNSVIANNVGVGVSIASPGTTARFDYNSLARNAAVSTTPSGAVHCATGVALTNSIFSDNGATPQVEATCNVSYSLFADIAPAGTGNRVGMPVFVNASGNNLHIGATSAARNMADPASTLMIDYDGQIRPQGAARDVGVDEVP